MKQDSILSDVIVFGSLLVAVALTVGLQYKELPLLVGVGLCAYLGAMELGRWLALRGVEQQDSLATTTAMLAVGFLYYFAVDENDLVLLIVTIALMFEVLMVCVGFISAITSLRVRPVIDVLITVGASAAMSLALGHLLLLPTLPQSTILAPAAVIAALTLWKLHRRSRRSGRRDAQRSSSWSHMAPALLAATVVLAFGCYHVASSLFATVAAALAASAAGVGGMTVYQRIESRAPQASDDEPSVLPWNCTVVERLSVLCFMAPALVYLLRTFSG